MAGEKTTRHEPAASTVPITIQTPAKVNLTLAVLGERPDGFHEIESLIVPVGLYDELALSESSADGIELSCDDPGVPASRDNLVWWAARRLMDRAGVRGGARLRLTKRIPIGAGLGGGSSDAAATLAGLNRLWGLGLDRAELAGLASEIGSDVPFFLHGGAAIVRGRGEHVEPVELHWPGWIVLVVPPFGMETAAVYGRWEPGDPPPRESGEVVAAIQAGEDLGGLLYNMLERPAFAIEPRLTELCAKLRALGGAHVRMSGSGSTLFALFRDPDQAKSFAAQATRQLGVRAVEVQTIHCEHP